MSILHRWNVLSDGRPAPTPQPTPIINTNIDTTSSVVAEEHKQSAEAPTRSIDMFEDAAPELAQEACLETVQAEIM